MANEKRVVKVTATLTNGEVVSYEGKELVIVMGGVEGNEGKALTLVDGSLPFMMYAHDTICEEIEGKKEAFMKSLDSDGFGSFVKDFFEGLTAATKEGKGPLN